jgi:hypothetical protein
VSCLLLVLLLIADHDRVHGCHGSIWQYNPYLQAYEGNPVHQPKFNAYFKALQNRDCQTGETVQALPMQLEDLTVMHTCLDSNSSFTEVQRLFFKAFSSLAFSLWTRFALP